MTELQVNPLINIILVIIYCEIKYSCPNQAFIRLILLIHTFCRLDHHSCFHCWRCSPGYALCCHCYKRQVSDLESWTITWTAFMVGIENKCSIYLFAQMEWTKPSTPAWEENQFPKPAKRGRDGDFPAKRPSEGKRWSRGVHCHSTWWSSRKIFIGLKLWIRTIGPAVFVDSSTALEPIQTQRCNCC